LRWINAGRAHAEKLSRTAFGLAPDVGDGERCAGQEGIAAIVAIGLFLSVKGYGPEATPTRVRS
jgi:hypothetical protein